MIILLIAGSGYDTQMLWVNSRQLDRRSVDPQNLRVKEDLGERLVKPAFYTDYMLMLGEKKWLAKDSESRTRIHSRVLTYSQHGDS